MNDFAPLESEIRRRIAAAGPMPVAQYMALCLTHPEYGYYVTHDPFGSRGDFITAPEISQMFGELIGLWMAAVWTRMDSPESVRVIELGPGRGTLMKDALRAVQVMPAFRNALVLHFVEISPLLEAQQKQTLDHLGVPAFWHASLNDVPKGPAIIVANEFFDALPVSQAVKTDAGWLERCVEIDAAGDLAFAVAPNPILRFERLLPAAVREAPLGSIFEWRADSTALEIGRRIAHDSGAALVIDYGHTASAIGETLQAVGDHAFADVLSEPGGVDLTAHVDFEALMEAAMSLGANGFGPVEQAVLLRRLGIETRASKLKAQASPEEAVEIDRALARLIGRDPESMGQLFKAVAFAHPKIGEPPGFEDKQPAPA